MPELFGTPGLALCVLCACSYAHLIQHSCSETVLILSSTAVVSCQASLPLLVCTHQLSQAACKRAQNSVHRCALPPSCSAALESTQTLKIEQQADRTGQDRTGQDRTGQNRTLQYRTVQCSTLQYSTVQYSTVQYMAMLLTGG